MNVFARSWSITKMSFGVIKEDKELLLFPIISSIFSTIFMAALLIPTVFLELIQQTTGTVEFEVLDYILLFVTYLGLALISTFFNVCVVYTTKVRLTGGNATFGESIKFAFSKSGKIFQWGIVVATVSLIFALIDNLAQNLGAAGEMILRVIRGALSFAWGIATIFVVPVMVFYDLSPRDAIKKSVKTLQETWGELLVRHFSMGLMRFLFSFLGLVVLVGGGVLVLIYLEMLTLAIVMFALALVYLIILNLIFNVADSVYKTALFMYGDKGKIPGEYTKEFMTGAFREKPQKRRVRG